MQNQKTRRNEQDYPITNKKAKKDEPNTLLRNRFNLFTTNHTLAFPQRPISNSAPNSPQSHHHNLIPTHPQRIRSLSEPITTTLPYAKNNNLISFQTENITPQKKTNQPSPPNYIPPQLPPPSISITGDDFQSTICNPSVPEISTPKSVKSPSKLSPILQPPLAHKKPDERIQIDQPLLIANQTNDENQVPKITRLSKRLQAMKAASELMKFNSSTTTKSITTTSSPFETPTSSYGIMPSIPSSRLSLSEGTNKPRARREPIQNNHSTKQSNIKSINFNCKRMYKAEQSETIQLSKLTTRQTNLNKKRFSIIKFEDVYMNTFRPPSPESNFRKNSKKKKSTCINQDETNRELDDISQDNMKEINVSSPTNNGTTTTSINMKDESSPQDNCDGTSNENLKGDLVSEIKSHLEEIKTIVKKKKVKWNQEKLVINLEEKYLEKQQEKLHKQEQKRLFNDEKLENMDQIKQEDEGSVQLEVEASVDPFFNLRAQSNSNPLSVSSSPSSPCSSTLAPIKSILKINFRNSERRNKKLQSSNNNNDEFVHNNDKEEEYKYELDDFGNLMINNNNHDIHHVHLDDPLKSLNLEPIFVKVCRRIWLD